MFARMSALAQSSAAPAAWGWVHKILFALVERIEATEGKRYYLLLLHFSNVIVALATEAREVSA